MQIYTINEKKDTFWNKWHEKDTKLLNYQAISKIFEYIVHNYTYNREISCKKFMKSTTICVINITPHRSSEKKTSNNSWLVLFRQPIASLYNKNKHLGRIKFWEVETPYSVGLLRPPV